jgi:translation initiation factor IF-2
MRIQIPDPITVKDLAEALGQRPYRVVADLMELGRMRFEGDQVEFETASKVAKKYGFETERQG